MAHTCHRCRRETFCKLPPWACPWLNSDDDNFCDDCTAAIAEQTYDIEQQIAEYESAVAEREEFFLGEDAWKDED